MYYDEDVLYAIASSIGKPIKIDINISLTTRGRFARVCIEVDLTKPLTAQFWLDGRWHSVEYEGLHIICFSCGKYGHLIDKCPEVPFVAEENQQEAVVGNTHTPPVTNQNVGATMATTSLSQPRQPMPPNLPNISSESHVNAYGHGPGMIAPKPIRRTTLEDRKQSREKQ